jgi:hypothetical protein
MPQASSTFPALANPRHVSPSPQKTTATHFDIEVLSELIREKLKA